MAKNEYDLMYNYSALSHVNWEILDEIIKNSHARIKHIWSENIFLSFILMFQDYINTILQYFDLCFQFQFDLYTVLWGSQIRTFSDLDIFLRFYLKSDDLSSNGRKSHFIADLAFPNRLLTDHNLKS